MKEKVFLIGYRGVGKSSVGKILSEALNYGFIDTDEEIARLRQKAVADIVALEGWQAFRGAEREVLVSLRKSDRVVVATGGGAVLHQDVWEELAPSGIVVWLKADVEVLRQRIGRDDDMGKSRPSLTKAGTEDEILRVLEERTPIYRRLADVELDTGVMEISDVVQRCVNLIKETRSEEYGR